jgi:hypothetical protein
MCDKRTYTNHGFELQMVCVVCIGILTVLAFVYIQHLNQKERREKDLIELWTKVWTSGKVVNNGNKSLFATKTHVLYIFIRI